MTTSNLCCFGLARDGDLPHRFFVLESLNISLIKYLSSFCYAFFFNPGKQFSFKSLLISVKKYIFILKKRWEDSTIDPILNCEHFSQESLLTLCRKAKCQENVSWCLVCTTVDIGRKCSA